MSTPSDGQLPADGLPLTDGLLLTEEHPAPGLRVLQPRRGFRYAMDPFLLVAWALEGGATGPFLDVGCGSGIMSLLLARLGHTVCGLDVLDAWLSLARRSAVASGLSVQWLHGDIRAVPSAQLVGVQTIICNPPYFPHASGPVSPDPMRAHARHELAGTLDELIAAMCVRAPRICLVLPAARSQAAQEALARGGRTVSRRCWIGDRLVLIEGRADAAGPPSERRVALMQDQEHTAQVHRWYQQIGAHLAVRGSGDR